jgi:O-antigen/teichoic acid export membrane protein
MPTCYLYWLLVSLATGPVGNLLVMTEYAGLQSRIVMVMALSNVILNYWLITGYGLYGAAIATAVVVALTNIISWIVVWLKHGVAIVPFLGIKQVAKKNAYIKYRASSL